MSHKREEPFFVRESLKWLVCIIIKVVILLDLCIPVQWGTQGGLDIEGVEKTYRQRRQGQKLLIAICFKISDPSARMLYFLFYSMSSISPNFFAFIPLFTWL